MPTFVLCLEPSTVARLCTIAADEGVAGEPDAVYTSPPHIVTLDGVEAISLPSGPKTRIAALNGNWNLPRSILAIPLELTVPVARTVLP